MSVAEFAIVLVAAALVLDAAAERNCTHSNGYKYAVCGDGLKDASQLCCKAAETCVQVETFSGDGLVACSEARQLTNSKAVKIAIIPLFFMFLQISLMAYLVVRCNFKESLVTKLCVVILMTSWPLLFSMYWAFGIYAAFLATMVAVAAAPSIDCPTMPWWTYRCFWAAALFQIIALFGPYEAFHVPIYQYSNGGNAEIIENIYSQTNCNSHYESYFTVLPIEKQAKEANPDADYNGYCSESWLATVQSFAILQSILWIGLVLVSARTLLAAEMLDIGPRISWELVQVLPASPRHLKVEDGMVPSTLLAEQESTMPPDLGNHLDRKQEINRRLCSGIRDDFKSDSRVQAKDEAFPDHLLRPPSSPTPASSSDNTCVSRPKQPSSPPESLEYLGLQKESTKSDIDQSKEKAPTELHRKNISYENRRTWKEDLHRWWISLMESCGVADEEDFKLRHASSEIEIRTCDKNGDELQLHDVKDASEERFPVTFQIRLPSKSQAAMKVEAERLEAELKEKAKQERLAKVEADRLAREAEAKVEQERAARAEEEERLAVEVAAKAEAKRVEAEAKAKEEAERVVREVESKVERERLAREEDERLAAEVAAKAEAERLEAKEKAEQERLAAEAVAAAAEAAIIAEVERLEVEAKEKDELERLAAETVAKDEAERAEAEAKAKEEAERLEVEAKAGAKRVVREVESKVERERLAREEDERLAVEVAAKAEAERLKAKAKETEERDRLAAEAAMKAEAERLEIEAKEIAERERLAKVEADRLAREAEAIAVQEQPEPKKKRD